MNLSPRDEPVAYAGAVTALAVAAIPILRALNFTITRHHSSQYLTIVAVLIVVLTALVREQVTPAVTSVPRKDAEAAIDLAMLAAPGDPRPVLKR